MKILLLIGSLRTNSYNRKLANAYKDIIGSGATFTEGDFSQFPHYNEEIQLKGFPPEVEKLGKQISEADAVLFVSPEYNYSVPGALKNALDWVSRLPSAPLAGKRASLMGASMGRLGTARMQYHLRQIGVFLDIHFMNKPEVMVGPAQDVFDTSSGKLTDERTASLLKKHFEAFKAFAGK